MHKFIVETLIKAVIALSSFIVHTHKIMSSCNLYHEQLVKKQYASYGNRTQPLAEWLFLPFGQPWADMVNLAEMWRVIGIMTSVSEREAEECQW